jgi:MtN3 and saliva related transmembrane protein
MSNWLPTILGLVAGSCTTFGYVPQVLKIWREGDTQAISMRMFVLRVVGLLLWLGYGFALGSLPLIIFNILSLLLAGTILTFKLRSSAPATARGRTMMSGKAYQFAAQSRGSHE